MKQPIPRRTVLAVIGGAILPVLGGCKEEPPGLPKPPYGRALDVTQANAFVEFDVRIEDERRNPLSRYDVVLEVFKKDPQERVPDSVLDPSNVHFKVSIKSLDASGVLIAEREVIGNKRPNGTYGKFGFSPSRTVKTELMSRGNYLLKGSVLKPGTYRIRCENINPISDLEGRLVKVILEPIHYPK